MIAVPDPVWVEAVAAVIVLRQGESASAEDLLAHARRDLASFKVLKRVFFAESLPKNTAGKLLTREPRAQYSGTCSAVMGVTE